MRTHSLTLALVGLSATALIALAAGTAPAVAETAQIPSPAIDMPKAQGTQTAVLAGGCFWGLEGVFEHVKGVKAVTSGYAGGKADEANYETVSTERTRHAEAVRIVYDPAQVSYGTLLRIYFSVAHDPTQLNRQGPDRGTSYRSTIFPIGAAQAKVARDYIAQLGKSGAYKQKIVTTIEGGQFFPAESYHQDFLNRNPDHPYIRINDLPKVNALKAAFPALYTPKSAA